VGERKTVYDPAWDWADSFTTLDQEGPQRAGAPVRAARAKVATTSGQAQTLTRDRHMATRFRIEFEIEENLLRRGTRPGYLFDVDLFKSGRTTTCPWSSRDSDTHVLGAGSPECGWQEGSRSPSPT
jgi:hypothetical protein